MSTSVAKALTTVYVNPSSSEELRNVAGYTLADGSPAIDVVCIFGGNYAASTLPYLRANNNNPPTDKPFNPNIQAVLDDGSVGYLQSKGLKVLMTVLNGHHEVGWSQFICEKDARTFADYLKTEVVDKYGLDGIDIDDEYSSGTPNDTSLIMVTTLMRQIMPSKLITKALWADIQYFQSTWQGHTLAENLDYGWEMSYGSPPGPRLDPYTRYGMEKKRLSLGFWSGSPSRAPAQDIGYLQSNGFAGFMMFAFEQQANVELMGQLVNDWYGSGNWNPPS